MKKSVAMKWAKALRSGKYKQTIDQLQNEEGYCCLGVLCEVAKANGVAVQRNNSGTLYGDTLCSQPDVKAWSGIAESGYLYRGTGYPHTYQLLTEANDYLELTFDEIADIIENEWENIT